MTEFITRNYGNNAFEIIIKTDSKENYKAAEAFARRLIDHAKPVTDNNVGCNWIPVTERLPEEHDSIFKSLYGTKNWLPGMFLKTSGMVLASIEKEDGTRMVKGMYTKDGVWYMDNLPWAKKVTHWMPLPEPPMEGE